VKNIGGTSLSDSLINKSDLFFGPRGNITYISYKSPTAPTWSYTIKNDIDADGSWENGETIEIIVTLSSTLTTGDYSVKFAVFNGESDVYTFSI
jgi:hypothetical protein